MVKERDMGEARERKKTTAMATKKTQPELPPLPPLAAPIGVSMKPGWRTSEGILTAIATITNALLATDLVTSSPVAVKIVAAVAASLSALGYTVVRSSLKKTDMGPW